MGFEPMTSLLWEQSTTRDFQLLPSYQKKMTFCNFASAHSQCFSDSMSRSYKNIFRIELNIAVILAFLLTVSNKVTIFKQSNCLNSSIRLKYFLESGPGQKFF